MLFRSVSIIKQDQKKSFVIFSKVLLKVKKKKQSSVFLRSIWEVFFFIKHFQKFLCIIKIPICLYLNIYFSLKHLFFLFKNPDNIIYF